MNDRQVAIYISQLGHKNESVRRSAVKLLSKSGAAAVPALLATLKSDNCSVCSNAAQILGKIGDAAAVPSLIEGLNNDYLQVRLACATSLGQLQDPIAVPALINALRHEDADVFIYTAGVREDIYTCATTALAEFGTPAAPDLIRALDDEDDRIRGIAAGALEQLGSSHVLPRRILADSRFSAQERIEVLEALYRAYHGDKLAGSRHELKDIAAFCRTVVEEDSPDASKGAQTVLNWLGGERDLLRASNRSSVLDEEQLLRAAGGTAPEGDPNTLLIASEPPADDR